MKATTPPIQHSLMWHFVRLRLILPVTALACCSLLPRAQAVSPAPDGGYAGGNTAEGQNALFSLTTGGYNTAVGYFSLRSNATGAFNTAIGAGALFANTADNNTATGAGALFSNTTGDSNTANGASALFANEIGVSNTAVGVSALHNNDSGFQNTAVGHDALVNNRTGSNNTAIGYLALSTNSTSRNNTAIGSSALSINNTGSFNTADGSFALSGNTTGSDNTALGYNAGSNITTAHNVICIGTTGQNVSDSFYVANVFQTAIDPDNLPVRIDFTGRLGTQSSSRRFKDHITPMDKGSEAILALNPVTFHYKDDTRGRPEFGLIAEEVAQVDPNLVVRDKEGKPYSVRYDRVNAMLLNEFLKEHRKVQELEATLNQQGKTFVKQKEQIEALTSALQKVSAQTEANKPLPPVVVSSSKRLTTD